MLVAVILFQTAGKTFILANYELNKEYIAKVLCVNKENPKMHCNGKCHLKKELNKAEKNEQSPLNRIKEKTEFQIFSQATNNLTIYLVNELVADQTFSPYTFNLSEKHLFSVFHPPQS